MRSLVVITALALAGGWFAIRHLPATAEADVTTASRLREVQSIAFDGRALPTADLRAALITRTGEVVDAEKLAADRIALTAALAARGYLAAQVKPAQVVYGDGGAAFVTFAVEQGPLFRVRSVKVAGATQLEAGVVTLGAGEVAIAHRIERARDALADRLSARGKHRAVVVANVSPDPAAGVVDIELVATR
ncbi:MAG TPA: POTRA domain-containing protein [Kofleriaceae bacterium]